MKYKALKYFAVFGILLILSSCSKDFLDTDPIGKMPVDNYYSTDDEAFHGIIAVYDILQWTYASAEWNSTFMLKTLPSDESGTGGADAGDQPKYQELNNFTYSAGNQAITGVFRLNYFAIYRCNMIINNVEPVSDVRKQIIAEAKALRAFFYFELVSQWGNVPLNLEELAPSEYQQAPATPAQIYAQIEKDLTEAIAVLPTKSEYDGSMVFRFSKGSAQFLLGKAYLYQKKWTDATQMFDQLMNSAQYSLTDDFSTLFKVEQEFGTESIFEVSWTNAQNYDWGTFTWNRYVESNVQWQLCGPRSITAGDFDGGTSGMIAGWGFLPPRAELYSAFEEMGDTYRKAATIWNVEDFAAMDGFFNTDAYQSEGMLKVKYGTFSAESSTEPGAVTELNYGTNFRLMRYADAVLMNAEAQYRAGDESKALQLLNMLRENRQLEAVSASGSELFDAIVAERRLELAFEGVRFLDLVRWDMAADVLGEFGFVKGKHELFPIPEDEMNNNQYMVQNPGY